MVCGGVTGQPVYSAKWEDYVGGGEHFLGSKRAQYPSNVEYTLKPLIYWVMKEGVLGSLISRVADRGSGSLPAPCIFSSLDWDLGCW